MELAGWGIAFIGGFVVILAAWLVTSFYVWAKRARARVDTLQGLHPQAVLASAQVAATTNRALRRIAKARQSPFAKAESYFTLVADSDELTLVKGSSQLQTIAAFSSSEVRDVRVGSTFWIYANYTTLFFGIAAGRTVFELPVRINGPKLVSLFPAEPAWAERFAARVLSVLRPK